MEAQKAWVVIAMARPLYPDERVMVHIVGETGWFPGSVWMGMEERKSLFPPHFSKE
jgi:hypothetical protein